MAMSRGSKGKSVQPRYDVATKLSAVRRVEAGESVASIASELGCRPNRIYYWLKQLANHGDWPERNRRRRRRERPAAGSLAREAELERLLGQKQAELDFLGEALRRIEQARRPTVEPRAPSPGSSSPPGRLGRKVG